jgi:predicted secreted protein
VDDHFLAAYRRSLRAVLPTRRTRHDSSNAEEEEEREEEGEKEVEKAVERRPVQWQVLHSKCPRIISHRILLLLLS